MQFGDRPQLINYKGNYMENFNAVTKATYSPSNQDHLDKHREAFELSSNEWAGFKQWSEAGRKVKKGAKGCKIFMVVDKKIQQEEGSKATDGEQQKRKVLKARYVFNKDHTEQL